MSPKRRIPLGKPGSLGDVICQRVGWREAFKVLTILHLWIGVLELEGGEAPKMDVVAEMSPKSKAQFYRDLRAFREAFPDEESPDRIARLVWSQYRKPSTPFAIASAVVHVA